MAIDVEFCGEITTVDDGATITIGREADLVVDDNPFLHRVFLTIAQHQEMWIVSNVGSQLSATVSDAEGQMEAFLSPGGALPLIFEEARIAFTAGPTSYELVVKNPEPSFRSTIGSWSKFAERSGSTTIGPTKMTVDQLLMILSLAEPRLRGDGRAATTLPTSIDAAARLGWTQTRFNRKLDNVCQKLTKAGVRGLYGVSGVQASGRRARLVEYAVATRLVCADHLELLEKRATDATTEE